MPIASTLTNQPRSTMTSSYPAFTIQASPSNPFATAMTNRTKHKLSPSPSPHRNLAQDVEMASPTRQRFLMPLESPQFCAASGSTSGSSPIEDSPTPACNISNAAARLRLGDDDSPVRRLPGHSRSLAAGRLRGQEAVPDSPLRPRMRPALEEQSDTAEAEFELPPQPLFTLPRSKSAEMRKASDNKMPRLSMSHPLRARASTQSASTMPPPPLPALAQKKAVSLDRLAQVGEMDEAFGSVAAPTSAMGHARKSSRGNISVSRHRRLQSSDGLALQSSMSRSSGQKSGLAANLCGLPDFSTSNSSLSSMATSHMTPPQSDFSPMPLPVFEDVRPLQEAFDQPTTTLTRKFKPRDSGVSMPEPKPEPPASVLRPPAYRTQRLSLNTAHAAQAEMSQQTPIDEEPRQAGPTFGFLGNSGLLIHARSSDKLSMPDTPIKRQARASEPTRGPRTSLQPLDPNLSSVEEAAGSSTGAMQWRGHPNSSPSSGPNGSDSQSDPDNTPTKMPVQNSESHSYI